MQRVPFLDDPGEGGEADGGGQTDSRQRAVSGEEGREEEQGGEIGRATAKALQVKVPRGKEYKSDVSLFEKQISGYEYSLDILICSYENVYILESA